MHQKPTGQKKHHRKSLLYLSGGGESVRKWHLRGGEQEPGAADSDKPVPTQAAARQHQPAQHDPEWSHRRRRQRRHRQIPGGLRDTVT